MGELTALPGPLAELRGLFYVRGREGVGNGRVGGERGG